MIEKARIDKTKNFIGYIYFRKQEETLGIVNFIYNCLFPSIFNFLQLKQISKKVPTLLLGETRPSI